MSTLLVNLDLGTTNCKALVFDLEGRQVCAVAREYSTYHPKPDYAEQDPEEWWRSACEVLKQAVAESASAGVIAAIAVTSQREGIVPVDAECKPLANCIIWMDSRTGPQAAELEDRLGRKHVYELTGVRIDPVFSAAKILWIKQHQPEVFQQADKFLQAEDFLLARLSGRYVTEHSIASRTMLMDVRKRAWAPELLEAVSLTAERMPELLAPGTALGPILPEAAKATGLPADTLVITGGGDQQCGALGAGATSAEVCSCSIGTASVISVTVPEPLMDDTQTLICGCAAIPGKWSLEPAIWTTGSVLRWFRDELAGPEVTAALAQGTNAYDIINEEAAAIPPGAEGVKVIPHFMGAGSPHWVPEARGVVFGLSLGHTRAHIARAIMEGVAYEIKANLEAIRALGVQPAQMRVLGGGAYSPLWRQIVASACKVEVALCGTAEAVSLGGAILAACGAGLYPNVDEAASAMCRVQEVTQPIEKDTEIYETGYAVYMELMHRLEPVFIKAFQ